MSAPTLPALQIHPGIQMKGRLSAEADVILTGKFEGELKTLGRLTVASGGAITGSIDAGSLVLEPGNLVEARVKIAPPPKSAFKSNEAAKRDASAHFWTGGIRKLKDVFSFGRK